MKNLNTTFKKINSISELHRLLSLSKPFHPLITLINHSETLTIESDNKEQLLLNFFNISIKRSFQGQMKYGKNYYDFDEGTMSFVAPNQIISIDDEESRNKDGWSLLFHPDLIRNYTLCKSIKNYGFFSYEVNEALHLSDEEEKIVESLVQNIQKEYQSRIDTFSQDVIVSNLELLLNYCNRFYSRQFLTRKMSNNDLLSNFETLLTNYFEENSSNGLPTVNYLAKELNISASYLSDMLKTVTGQSTQEHIHNKIIEKAKELLTTSNLSVSEIAYFLGFEHSQSFNKLFKSKVNLSPLAFKASFN